MAWGAVGGRMGLLGEGIRCVRIIGNIEKNEFRMRAVIKEVRKLLLNVCVGLEYGPGKADSDQTRISSVLHSFRGCPRMDSRCLGTREK